MGGVKKPSVQLSVLLRRRRYAHTPSLLRPPPALELFLHLQETCGTETGGYALTGTRRARRAQAHHCPPPTRAAISMTKRIGLAFVCLIRVAARAGGGVGGQTCLTRRGTSRNPFNTRPPFSGTGRDSLPLPVCGSELKYDSRPRCSNSHTANRQRGRNCLTFPWRTI